MPLDPTEPGPDLRKISAGEAPVSRPASEPPSLPAPGSTDNAERQLLPAPSGATAYSAWRDATLKLFLDSKNYWTDRRLILADESILRAPADRLQTGPFSFGLNGLVLPGLIIGLLYSGYSAVFDLPKTQIDRAIDSQKKTEDILDSGGENKETLKTLFTPLPEAPWTLQMPADTIKHQLSDTEARIEQLKGQKTLSKKQKAEMDYLRQRFVDLTSADLNRTVSDLQVQVGKARREATRNRITLMTINKVVGIVDGWQNVIIGIAVVLSAYIFAGWVRRLRPPLAFPGMASDVYLYIIGSRVLMPSIAAATMNVCLDLAIRYDANRFVANVYPILMFLVGIWILIVLVISGRQLQRILGDRTATKFGRVTWRLLGSQVAASLLIQTPVAVVATVLFLFIQRFQK